MHGCSAGRAAERVVHHERGGNGVGEVRFTPEQADGLRGLTLGILWTLSIGTTVAYQTACTEVTLD